MEKIKHGADATYAARTNEKVGAQGRKKSSGTIFHGAFYAPPEGRIPRTGFVTEPAAGSIPRLWHGADATNVV